MAGPTRTLATLVLAALGALGSARAEPPTTPGSLTDLLNAPTSVASGAGPQALREAPGLVTVITREEIVALGARDLLDVLQRVPGFASAQDTKGTIGLGVRGSWAFEGKALLLVDGHEMNEIASLTVPLGDHFPAENIERVEIVRGPGSVVHGGYAELAVINVVTRRPASLHGLSIAARYGGFASGQGWARRSISLSYADTFKVGAPLSIAASAHLGESRLSAREQEDVAGARFSMLEGSARKPAFFTLNVDWGRLSVSVLYDDYALLDRTLSGVAQPRPYRVGSEGVHFQASYALEYDYGLVVTPRLRYKQQSPWHNTDADGTLDPRVYYDVTAERWEGSLTATWRHLSWLDALLGGAYTYDRAWSGVGDTDHWAGGGEVRHGNSAVFAEIVARTVVDMTVGARFERHSIYGDSFVPRLALTGTWGGLHAKLLAAEAFKAPGLESLDANPELLPERSTAFELELGTLLSRRLFAAVSGFYVVINDPILHAVSPSTGEGTYLNGDKAGTCGVEAELRFRERQGWATLSYSFYSAACSEQPGPYAVPGQKDAVLGFANHKLALAGSFEVLSGLHVAPSLLLFSGRWFASTAGDGTPTFHQARPAVLLDLWLTYRPKAFAGFGVSAGVHNLFDQRFDLVQPYQGGKPPMHALDREIGVRLAYEAL